MNYQWHRVACTVNAYDQMKRTPQWSSRAPALVVPILEIEMRSRGLGYLLVAFGAWFAHPAGADVIIFHDLVDQITVEHIGSEHTMVIDGAIAGSGAGSCAPGEAFQCFVRLSSPTGATPNGPSKFV